MRLLIVVFFVIIPISAIAQSQREVATVLKEHILSEANQALKEAELALKYGYDLGLVSLGGLNAWSDVELIKHMASISEVIPVFGFYLQPSVGGRLLSFEYWRDFVQPEHVALEPRRE